MGRILYVDTGELRQLASGYRVGAEAVEGIGRDVELTRRSLKAPRVAGISLPAALGEQGSRVAASIRDLESFLRSEAHAIDRLAGGFDDADRRSTFRIVPSLSGWTTLPYFYQPVFFNTPQRLGRRAASVMLDGLRILPRWGKSTVSAGRSRVNRFIGVLKGLPGPFKRNAVSFRDRLRNFVAQQWNRIWNKVSPLLVRVKAAIDQLVRSVAEAFRSIGEVLNRAGRWVVQSSIDFVRAVVTNPIAAIKILGKTFVYKLVEAGVSAFIKRQWLLYRLAKKVPFVGTLVALPEIVYRETRFLTALSVELYCTFFDRGSFLHRAATEEKFKYRAEADATLLGAIPVVGTVHGVWELMDSQRGTVGDPPGWQLTYFERYGGNPVGLDRAQQGDIARWTTRSGTVRTGVVSEVNLSEGYVMVIERSDTGPSGVRERQYPIKRFQSQHGLELFRARMAS